MVWEEVEREGMVEGIGFLKKKLFYICLIDEIKLLSFYASLQYTCNTASLTKPPRLYCTVDWIRRQSAAGAMHARNETYLDRAI